MTITWFTCHLEMSYKVPAVHLKAASKSFRGLLSRKMKMKWSPSAWFLPPPPSPSPQRFPSFFPTVCQTARLLSCSLTALWSHFPTVAALSPATPMSPLPLPSYRLKSMKLHRPFLSPLTLWILFGLVLWILLPSRCALASLCLPLWMLSGLVSPTVWLSARRVGLFLQNLLCPRLAGLFKMSDESVRAVIYFLFFFFPSLSFH